MNSDLPVVVLEKIKKAQIDVSAARVDFEQLVAVLESWLGAEGDDGRRESAESALSAENQRLLQENESFRQELDRAKAEVEKHRSQYLDYQKTVQKVLTEKFQETLGQLKLKDPISDLRRQRSDLTKRTERDSQELAMLKEREASANQEIESFRTRNDDLGAQLQTKIGLLERYNQEKADLLQKHDRELRDLKRQLVTSLVNQIGQRYYMPVVEHLAEEGDLSPETLAAIGKRLLGHFRALDLAPLYKVQDRVEINGENWDQFEIEGGYEPDLRYLVTNPGLKLGEEILVKPRVTRQGEDTHE